jgi:hypothetical protein
MAVNENNQRTRTSYQSVVLDAVSGILQDNSSRLVSAEDLRQALWDLVNGAALRKDDPYVRYAIPSAVGGTANAITVSLTNDYPTSYTNAIPIRFQAQLDSSSDVTININSIGNSPMYKENLTRVSSGDLVQNSFYECVYNSDADGSGTAGFTLYEGIGGSVAPSVVQVTGTTQTVDSPNAVYVFTGSSACTVTIDTSAFTVGQGFKWINMGTAFCSLSANSGTVRLSDPFEIWDGEANEFTYTGITSYEWCAV